MYTPLFFRNIIYNISTLFKFFIFYIVCIYLTTSIINFIYPITLFLSLLIIIINIFFAYFLTKHFDFEIFKIKKDSFVLYGNKFIDIALILSIFTIIIWFLIIITKPSWFIDANYYHLPLSTLINSVKWYKGLANLSHHFGFPNGSSLISSLFTIYNVAGFESIFNITVWLIYGLGIFIYLLKNNLSFKYSIGIALVFMLMPPLLWKSCNIDTDIPCNTFLLFGFLSLSKKNYDDTLLFFGLSSVFKTLGFIAFSMTLFFLIFNKIVLKINENKINLKILLALLLVLISILRIFIATGNPLFPMIIAKPVSFGISIEGQKNCHIELNSGNKIRNFNNFTSFIKKFIFEKNPRISSNSFMIFFLPCLFVFILLLFKLKKNRLNFRTGILFQIFLIIFLLGIWLFKSANIRFIYGVLVFINIIMLIFITNNHDKLNIIFHRLIKFSMILSIIISLSYLPGIFVYKLFPYIPIPNIKILNKINNYKSICLDLSKNTDFYFYDDIESHYTNDGFLYYKTKSGMGRTKPPCLSNRSTGNDLDIINEYRKHI